ncbi:MAG: hypothetical protein PHC66_05160 [Candidatus Nanoarchaeia archaeon]|nr:hypothetical protein [Candidatus Nanoarchaeia archaeon]MDD5239075.1 hypothetical protein [Candidatus Nanoarchaeia archaeon]
MNKTLTEILKKDPKDVTIQEKECLDLEEISKLADRFNKQYESLIQQANEPYKDKENVSLVFCDGKLVKAYTMQRYDIPFDEISKIEQEQGKACYVVEMINKPSEDDIRIFEPQTGIRDSYKNLNDAYKKMGDDMHTFEQELREGIKEVRKEVKSLEKKQK